MFLLLTFLLAWLPALLLRDVWSGGTGPWITRFLAASAIYAATMGWQPLFAALLVRRWFERFDPLDQGIRPSSIHFAAVASIAPVVLIVASVGVAWAATKLGAPGPTSLYGLAEPELTAQTPSLATSALVAFALLLTIVILYVQGFSEEYGWRGYFLSRLMRELGPRRGLLVHGAVWGLWYSPPFLLASQQVSQGALRCVAFMLTCTLLGTLLGWIRLASRSIMPAVIANVMLTLVGGLPLILQNGDVGLRGTSYGPAGWIPLVAVVAVVLFGRWRAAIVTPLPEQGISASVLALIGQPTSGADASRPN